jgi:hypothetical protein
VTAPRKSGRPALYALPPVEPAHLLLGLFVLFGMQVVAVALWQSIVGWFYDSLHGPVLPFVAAMSCSVAAFITTVYSRPSGRRESLVACGAALLAALAVSLGVAVAALAVQYAVPGWSDGILARAFVACMGFWSGTPVIYGAAVRLGLRRIEGDRGNGRPEL